MRLTKEIRADIIEKALAASDLAKLGAELDADMKALAKLAYNLAVKVPPAISKLTKAEKSKWLLTDTTIALDHPAFQGWRAGYTSDTMSRYLPFDDPVIVPRYQDAVKAADYPELQAAADAVAAKHKAVVKYERDLRGNLCAIVNSASTAKQLAELWPEGAEFLPPTVAEPSALVPTDTITAVNIALQLPRSPARPRKKG